MDINLEEEQMTKALHMLMKDDKEYKEELVSDLTPDEYERFLKVCPEFLEDE